MAFVTFSIPRNIKDEFEETFLGRNKSAIIAALMLDAIECERRLGAHVDAVDELLMMRATPRSKANRDVSCPRRRVCR
jgi:hypothetical protein